MDPVAERVARNDAAFRSANERIVEAAAGKVERVPFICECADATCTEIVWLTFVEYEAIRANDVRFLNAPGHERNALGWVEVVDRNDRFVTVDKVGDAAALVKQLAPREWEARDPARD